MGLSPQKMLNRQLCMFCGYHQSSLDCGTIGNRCQGKGESGREWVVSGEKGEATCWPRPRGMGVILQIIKQSDTITSSNQF